METRITQLTVVPDGQPIYSEEATEITLTDEAGGEFVCVRQTGPRGESVEVRINPDEWPYIRDAIDQLTRIAK